MNEGLFGVILSRDDRSNEQPVVVVGGGAVFAPALSPDLYDITPFSPAVHKVSKHDG